MSGFSWNVRGLNKISKHSIISQWVTRSGFQFGCLLETKVKEAKASRLLQKIFPDWSAITNYEFTRLGRIWVVWSGNARLTPVFKSGQMITCSVLLMGQDTEFFCSFIYASNSEEERRELWEDINNHHDAPMFRNHPWILCGDFNEILVLEEHSNGGIPSGSYAGMRDFQNTVRYSSLTDLSYHGPQFTWCNKRDEGGLICKKLDRFLVNEKWLDVFINSYSVFEAGGCSDHARGRVILQVNERRGRKPFKFSNILTSTPQFHTTIRDFWSNTTPLFISTSAMYRFSKKLKKLKPYLRNLGRLILGDLSKRTKESYEDLCMKQQETLNAPTPATIEDENRAYERWQHLSNLEEGYLKQKAKLQWLEVGDRNNAYFHRSCQIRRMQNSIYEVVGQNGELLEKNEDIKTEAVRFFEDFLTQHPENLRICSVDMLKEELQFRCTEMGCLNLE